MRRIFKKISIDIGSLALAGLAVVGADGTALASDTPQPTFLESGDNDLIRFQMGGVPTEETMAQFLDAPQGVSEPLPAARENTVTVSEGNGLQKTLERKAADSPALQEARTREQAGSGRQASQDTVAAAVPTQPAPASVSEPDGIEARTRALEEDQDTGLFARSAPRAKSFAGDTALENKAARDAPAQPAPALQTPLPQPGVSEEISSRLVAVCLNNPDDSSGPKAFDIRRDGPPRYVAGIGATACARFEPTRHTLYLWKTNDIGALSLILSNRLDLNEADGTQVTLDWIRDR